MVFRVRTVAEIFDLAVRIYRRRFVQLFIVSAVGLLPGLLFNVAAIALQGYVTLQLVGATEDINSVDRGMLSTYSTLNTLGSLVQNVATLLQAALSFGLAVPMITMIFVADLQGESIGLREALRRIGKIGWNLVALLAILGGLYFAVLIWFILPCIGWGTGFPMLLLFSWVAPTAVCVLIMEGRQAWEAVKRGWVLCRRRLWPTIGVIYLLSIFDQVVVIGPLSIVAAGLLIPLQGAGYNEIVDMLPSLAGGSVLGLLTISLAGVLAYPITVLFGGLWYLDLRTRFEALDLSVRAYARSGAPLYVALADAPNPRGERFMRGDDLGQFFLITLAFIGVGVAVWGLLTGVVFAMSTLARG